MIGNRRRGARPLGELYRYAIEYFMAAGITDTQYAALAELRFLIRLFLREGDTAARNAGLEPQQYLMLLAIRGLPPGKEATIRVLADRVALKHHSVVELIDRLELHGLARRTRSRDDRRRVLITLLPRGEKLLAEVAAQRISELRATGTALVKAISALLERKPKSMPAAHDRKAAKKGRR